MVADLLWPRYAGPDDLADVGAIPLPQRGLPASTYALLDRAAQLWPDRTALTVLPDADRWHVTVTVDPLADQAALRAQLDRYTVTSQVKERS